MKRPASSGINRPGPKTGREVLFEFHKVGRITRVTAIDPITGTEIVMVGAPGYSADMLKRLAARKLFYVIDKNRKKPL